MKDAWFLKYARAILQAWKVADDAVTAAGRIAGYKRKRTAQDVLIRAMHGEAIKDAPDVVLLRRLFTVLDMVRHEAKPRRESGGIVLRNGQDEKWLGGVIHHRSEPQKDEERAQVEAFIAKMKGGKDAL